MKNPNEVPKVQCPNCPNQMGSLARFCNACGAQLPASRKPEVIFERAQKALEDNSVFGTQCGPRYHRMLIGLAAFVSREKNSNIPIVYCPDCGRKLAELAH